MILLPARWFLPLLLVGSCSTYQASDVCTVDTSSGLPVIHTEKFGYRLITSQKVVIVSSSDTFEFFTQLEVTDKELLMVAMSSLGNKLFQLSGRHGAAEITTWGVPLDFDAGYLMADLGLIYARPGIIMQCLVDTGLPIKFSLPDTRTRTFMGKGIDISIEYTGDGEWPATVRYINNVMSYEIQVQTLAVEFL